MKSILITGACGGMGRAAVKLFAQNGYRVFALDRIACDAADNVIPVTADVTSEESVSAAYASVCTHTEHLDAIVHFAGIYMLDSLVEMDDAWNEFRENGYKDTCDVLTERITASFAVLSNGRSLLPPVKNAK